MVLCIFLLEKLQIHTLDDEYTHGDNSQMYS